jgi:hypothetical protein
MRAAKAREQAVPHGGRIYTCVPGRIRGQACTWERHQGEGSFMAVRHRKSRVIVIIIIIGIIMPIVVKSYIPCVGFLSLDCSKT